MQPETVATRLVAAENRRILGEAEPLLGGLDLTDQADRTPCGDGLQSGLLSQTDGEGELPCAGTQLQGHVEHRRRRKGTIGFVSRCHG